MIMKNSLITIGIRPVIRSFDLLSNDAKHLVVLTPSLSTFLP